MINSLNKNILAQGYSQIVTLAVQIATVPFLIHFWGLELFGVWVILTAIPTYLALSDFGFTFIAKNNMSMFVSAGNRQQALVTFQSIFILLIGICLVLGTILYLCVIYIPFDRILNIGEFSVESVRSVLLLQFFAVLIYQFFLLNCAGLRCEGFAVAETFLAATGRLLEAISIVVIASLGFGLIEASIGILAVRVLFLGLSYLIIRIKISWLNFNCRYVQKDRIKELAGPSLSYMLVPMTNALMIQSPIMVLGAFSTPAIVAMFSVSRTVARLGMSGANMLSYAFTPEYSYAWGEKNFFRFKKALNYHFKLLALGMIVYLIISLFFITDIVEMLSKENIKADLVLCLLLSLAVIIEMLWTTFFTPLVAVNRHKKLPIVVFLISLVFIILSYIFHSIIEIASLICVANFLILICVAKEFKNHPVFYREI
ncbi:hypothetical protein C9E88_003830 [Acinetobacter cumulans]|uniref:lipopolysaccharide biosynthesis protein n=1 Tax=Acinetobacter cumulans TaxID=2136182 RepID=UPI000D11551C|nr:hypothetical protein [Acinetobacter cumulans]QCO20700.1 hypothetical protein C9E88_003830 [Acinetobacter cumulans]